MNACEREGSASTTCGNGEVRHELFMSNEAGGPARIAGPIQGLISEDEAGVVRRVHRPVGKKVSGAQRDGPTSISNLVYDREKGGEVHALRDWGGGKRGNNIAGGHVGRLNGVRQAMKKAVVDSW
jgi:hypothetical protein